MFPLSTATLVNLAGLGCSSFYRWRGRIARGEMPVGKPGPKNAASIDLEGLEADINLLGHCRKRTHNTGLLHKKYGAGISRRELNRLVREARDTENRRLDAGRYHLTWKRPDLVWAMDGCGIKTDLFKMYIQNVQDLCSTYKFNPLVTMREPGGQEVAEYLHAFFIQQGPPLFLKRDNARNYNNHAVDDLLKEAAVIPINSPCYYARYNGGIEHAQGEMKVYIRHSDLKAETAREASLLGKIGVHDLNHKPRRKLKGKNACQSYFSGNRLRYNRRKRKEVFDWIRDLAFDISVKSGMDKIDPTAWRIACRKWMEKNGMITIRKKGNVLPNFSLNLCHN